MKTNTALFWIATVNAILNGMLLVLEWEATHSPKGYFSAMLGWVAVAIIETRQ